MFATIAIALLMQSPQTLLAQGYKQIIGAALDGLAGEEPGSEVVRAWFANNTPAGDHADLKAQMADAVRAMDAWKACAKGAAVAWSGLAEPAETIADGAIGKCAPQAELYDRSLLRLRTSAGVIVFAVADAEALKAKLQAAWRPRLIAVVLDRKALPHKPTR